MLININKSLLKSHLENQAVQLVLYCIIKLVMTLSQTTMHMLDRNCHCTCSTGTVIASFVDEKVAEFVNVICTRFEAKCASNMQ